MQLPAPPPQHWRRRTVVQARLKCSNRSEGSLEEQRPTCAPAHPARAPLHCRRSFPSPFPIPVSTANDPRPAQLSTHASTQAAARPSHPFGSPPHPPAVATQLWAPRSRAAAAVQQSGHRRAGEPRPLPPHFTGTAGRGPGSDGGEGLPAEDQGAAPPRPTVQQRACGRPRAARPLARAGSCGRAGEGTARRRPSALLLACGSLGVTC